jgi:arylsulfatase A-like enzyme
MTQFRTALFLCLLAGTASAAEPPAKRPNILFIFSDDHATQAIGCYGSRLNATPHIDRIAREGMLFRSCYCTNSICGPSRAVVLTGKHSHLNGFLDNNHGRFDGSQVTFPKLLKAAGYQTAMIGKWHLETDPTGFDYWNILIGQGPYYNPPMIENGVRKKYTGYTTDIITDLALEQLKKLDRSKPFLMMYQHKGPHREWSPNLKDLPLYDETEFPEPATLFDDYSGRGSAAKNQEMQISRDLNELDLKLTPPKSLNPEQLQQWNAHFEPRNAAFRAAKLEGKELVRWKYNRYLQNYLRCVHSVDENIGRVLKYLDDNGLADNTIVVYSSDQGFYLGEHGWFDKRFMYEESYRMPLMVRWPGKVQPGTENKDLVSNLDFAQTLLDAAGVEASPDMQGASLLPLLRGETPAEWRKSLYYHYYEFPGPHSVARHYGVKTARHKLMHFYHIGEWEMYDLEADPREMKNVYADPAYATQRAELERELARLRKHYRVTEDPPPAPKK